MPAETKVTEPELRELFAEVFEIAAETVTDEASPETVDSWDSFGHLRLITTLEERFGVVLSMDDVLEIDSYGALKSTVINGIVSGGEDG